MLTEGFFLHFQKNDFDFKNFTLNILKMTRVPFPSFKNTECINMQIEVELLDTRHLLLLLPVKSQCLWPEGFKFPNHTVNVSCWTTFLRCHKSCRYVQVLN